MVLNFVERLLKRFQVHPILPVLGLNRQFYQQSVVASDADLQQEAVPALVNDDNVGAKTTQPQNKDTPTKRHPYQFIPLKMGGGGRTHVPSSGSRYLMEHEVTLKDLQKVTDNFYELAFQDKTLDKFIRSHNDPHGSRFAKWIDLSLRSEIVRRNYAEGLYGDPAEEQTRRKTLKMLDAGIVDDVYDDTALDEEWSVNK